MLKYLFKHKFNIKFIMNINRQRGGRRGNIEGKENETNNIYNIKENRNNILDKLKSEYNIPSNSDLLLVDKPTKIYEFLSKNQYTNFSKEGILIERPIDNKRGADIIILFKDNNNKIYSIGIDCKKESDSESTQLARKTNKYIIEFINKNFEDNEIIETIDIFKEYVNYDTTKRRTFLESQIYNSNQDKFKKTIFNIFNKLKKVWIKERFDNNPLYHIDFIMYGNCDKIININKILENIIFDNMVLRRTNYTFIKDENNLLTFKPYASSRADCQIFIHKSCYNLIKSIPKNNKVDL